MWSLSMVHSSSFGNNHRQNALPTLPQQGVITEKSHWGWIAGTVALALFAAWGVFFPQQSKPLFVFLGSLM